MPNDNQPPHDLTVSGSSIALWGINAQSPLAQHLQEQGHQLAPLPSDMATASGSSNIPPTVAAIVCLDKSGANPERADVAWQIVTNLRNQSPHLPILLLNEHGDDPQAAVKALGLGVFRYLEAPRDKEVLRWLGKALAANRGDMVVEKASKDWVEIEASASFDNAQRLDIYFENLIRSAKLSQDEVDDLTYALKEMVNNAIEWGCKEDPNKRFSVSCTVFATKAIIKIEDSGEGFDFKRFFANSDDEIAAKQKEREEIGKRPGGLGISLVRQMVDEIKFNQRGNVVLLTKHFRSDG